MAVMFLDITEKLQKQENIRRLEKSIQQMRNLERLGVLAGGIAHDFNNILTAIIGNLDLLHESLPQDSENAELIQGANKAAWRARDLTQQLLTFAKGGDPIRETSSMVGVIRDSADFILSGSTIRVEYAFPDDLWLVDIDKGQMSQVIQNVIVNAKQAMPRGGTINVSAENMASISAENIPLALDRSYIRIAVADQGSGIPEAIHDKVFEPYFTTKQGGSGLGLAIAFSIIKRHEGYICFESETGLGTTFHIYLPISSAKREPSSVPAQSGACRRLSVLVVDDEEPVRRLYGAIGKRTGHRMMIVTSGAEAIERYREHHASIDLVVMDLTIPGGIGGKEAAAKLLEINPRAKIVVSSGYSNDPTMAAFATFGFCAMLPKPFRIDDFVALVNRVFDHESVS